MINAEQARWEVRNTEALKAKQEADLKAEAQTRAEGYLEAVLRRIERAIKEKAKTGWHSINVAIIEAKADSKLEKLTGIALSELVCKALEQHGFRNIKPTNKCEMGVFYFTVFFDWFGS